MNLTARLNALHFDDLAERRRLLLEIFAGPLPESLSILPPFFCDYGLGASFGERVFINQGCFFLDLGGISIEDDVWIGAAATITRGVTIGRGSVVGAGAVGAKDVPRLSVVTGTSVVERKRLTPPSGPTV